jgi:TATA-box binding protein (TBP) (component of TFIID and TFIIIB)
MPIAIVSKKRKRMDGIDEVHMDASVMARKRFKNQVSLKYTAPHPGSVDKTLRRNVMLFSKGKIHVTGSRSVMDAILSAEIVLDAIVDAGGASNIVPSKVQVVDAHQAMINTDFNVGVALRLAALRDACARYSAQAKYEPDTHPGVIIRFRSVTIMAFSTGRCIITGAKTLRKVVEGYSFILGAIHDNIDEIVMRDAPPEATKSRRPPRNSEKTFVEVAKDSELPRPDKRPRLVRHPDME